MNPTPPGPSVREVAERLSGAQREALRHGTEIGGIALAKTRNALIRHGLATNPHGHPAVLDWTPLGLAVRAHLLAHKEAADPVSQPQEEAKP